MGYKKTAKLKNPERHKVFVALRKSDKNTQQWWKNAKGEEYSVRVPDQLTEFQDSRGNIMLLNINKRVMLQKPYVREEFKNEVVRSIRKAMQQHEAIEKFEKEKTE